MKLGKTRIPAALVVVCLVTACGTSSAESATTTAATVPSTAMATATTAVAAPTTTAAAESPTAETAPFHAVTDDAVVVWGTGVCQFPEAEGWLVVCELDMSDPRVSGTETQEGFRFVVGRIGIGDVWVAEKAHITNAEGSWRGSAQGAENPAAVPAGEAHYVGEGAYEGLEFHYYFFHDAITEDGPTQLRGWISDGG